LSELKPVFEARKNIYRIWDLLDKYMKNGISIDELKELKELLKERYRYASSLQEAIAIAALYSNIEVTLSRWGVTIVPLYPRLDVAKIRELIEKVDKWVKEVRP